MEKFAHDTIVPYQNSTKSKKEQVADMFDGIALRYDLLNRLLSGGIDVYWRKRAIKKLSKLRPSLILDVATGTADLALLTHKILKPQKIVGIDISEGMLKLGREKIAKAGLSDIIELYQGDSEAIKYPTYYFDAVTVSFGVRNFQNLTKGLNELYRVIKPGGRLVVLEFSKPTNKLFKSLYRFYMDKFSPLMVGALSTEKKAYQYLNKSVQVFPEGKVFLEILEDAGFCNTRQTPLTFGICSIYEGDKK